MKDKTLSIITVTYNSEDEIEDFVSSFRSLSLELELWLVDNASSDRTSDLINQLATSNPWIKVKCNEENIGLAAANNLPLPDITSKYTAIINPDVVLHRGALDALVSYLDAHQNVVAVAPVNVDSNGLPHSSFHRQWSLLHLIMWRLVPMPITRSIYGLVRSFDEQSVLFASGSCIMMRTEDLKNIGGYDPEYFLTVEDVCDLCLRLRDGDKNRRVVVTPSAQITHLISRSAITVPLVTMWNGARGSVYHFKKHGGKIEGVIAYAIVFTSLLVRVTWVLPLAPFFSRYRLALRNNLVVLHRLVVSNPLFIEIKKAKPI